MGDFNHGNIKWDSLQSTGVEDQRFLCLVQDNFLTQHVLEPTRAARVLDIVLSSQKEFVDNVVSRVGVNSVFAIQFQFQFRSYQFQFNSESGTKSLRQFNSNSNSDDGNSTPIPVNSVIHRHRSVLSYRHYIGIFKKK